MYIPTIICGGQAFNVWNFTIQSAHMIIGPLSGKLVDFREC